MEAIRTAIECGAIAGDFLARASEHRKKAAFLEKCAEYYSQSVCSALEGLEDARLHGAPSPAGRPGAECTGGLGNAPGRLAR